MAQHRQRLHDPRAQRSGRDARTLARYVAAVALAAVTCFLVVQALQTV
jgi:hypothetical protein